MTENEKTMLDTFMQVEVSEPAQDNKPREIDFTNYLIDFTKPMTPPRFLMQIDNVAILPAGGITAITGRAKQGKTQFLASLVSCMLSGREFGRMRRKEAPAGSILWVDTEQSTYNIQKTIQRVYTLAGIPEGEDSREHGLYVLETSPLKVEERREAIQQAVEAIKPAVLVIDGIRDIVHDFNSIIETEELLLWLRGALEILAGLRIMLVLHTNPGSDKMRGHLGTELDNKLCDKFTCIKENGIFSVSHTSRDRELQTPFTFRIDEAGELATSTLEELGGAVNADTAFIQAVPEEGAPFNDIVKKYARLTGLTQVRAKEALKAKLNDTKELIKDEETKLFYRAGTPKQNNLF